MVMPFTAFNDRFISNIKVIKHLLDKYIPLLVFRTLWFLAASIFFCIYLPACLMDKVFMISRGSINYIDSCISGKTPPHNCKSVLIDDPFNNRQLIIQHGKGVPGVYVFQDKVSGAMYVGSAKNLYNRVTSYFMPSIVGTNERRVYRYFNKYGYANLRLTLFILPTNTSVTNILQLEQFLLIT